MEHNYTQLTKVADIGAGVSIGGFTLTLESTNEVVQIVAGLVAIVAGIAAAVFHIKRTIALNKAKKNE